MISSIRNFNYINEQGTKTNQFIKNNLDWHAFNDFFLSLKYANIIFIKHNLNIVKVKFGNQAYVFAFRKTFH